MRLPVSGTRATPDAAVPAQGGDVDAEVARAALAGVLDGVLAVDQDTGRIVYANPTCLAQFGYHHDELLGRPVELLVPARLHETHRRRRAEYVASPTPRPMDERGDVLAVRKDGTVFPARISLASVPTPLGPVITAVIRDVSVRRRLERHLDISQERFAAAFDVAPTGMAIIDARPDHPARIIAVNTALAELAGVRAADLVGRPGAEVLDLLGSEGLLVRPDGSARWVSMSSAVVHDVHGAPDCRVVHVLDLTDRKRVQDEERAQAARDARIAAVLQDGLMPYVPRRLGPIAASSRYRAAGLGEAVGGDWADVFALPDGRIGLVVGDVAGHGVEAAAAMARLRALVRMLATSGLGPAAVLHRLGDAMGDGTDDGGLTGDIAMATLVHAQLDPRTGRLVYSTAGHLPMLHVPTGPADEPRRVTMLPTTQDPPIGALPGLAYTERAVDLEPGERLIGFTDGLVETRSRPLDETLAALVDGLSQIEGRTARDVEELADFVLSVAPGDGLDDIALIVVGFETLEELG